MRHSRLQSACSVLASLGLLGSVRTPQQDSKKIKGRKGWKEVNKENDKQLMLNKAIFLNLYLTLSLCSTLLVISPFLLGVPSIPQLSPTLSLTFKVWFSQLVLIPRQTFVPGDPSQASTTHKSLSGPLIPHNMRKSIVEKHIGLSSWLLATLEPSQEVSHAWG